jgi:hypothetical protein
LGGRKIVPYNFERWLFAGFLQRIFAIGFFYCRLQVLQISDKDKNSTMLAQKIFCFARKILKQRPLVKGSGLDSARVDFKAQTARKFFGEHKFFR